MTGFHVLQRGASSRLCGESSVSRKFGANILRIAIISNFTIDKQFKI